MQTRTDKHQPLTREQGAALVALARQTLDRHFGGAAAQDDYKELETPHSDLALQARCGTFVTLKIDNQLRGCIGSLSATAPILEGVCDNALNAALHDRGSPLGKKGAENRAYRGERAFRAGPTGLY